jgi:hypothetical protein
MTTLVSGASGVTGKLLTEQLLAMGQKVKTMQSIFCHQRPVAILPLFVLIVTPSS